MRANVCCMKYLTCSNHVSKPMAVVKPEISVQYAKSSSSAKT